MYWSWAQDYYSFVLSPFHDIITGHNEASEKIDFDFIIKEFNTLKIIKK